MGNSCVELGERSVQDGTAMPGRIDDRHRALPPVESSRSKLRAVVIVSGD